MPRRAKPCHRYQQLCRVLKTPQWAPSSIPVCGVCTGQRPAGNTSDRCGAAQVFLGKAERCSQNASSPRPTEGHMGKLSKSPWSSPPAPPSPPAEPGSSPLMSRVVVAPPCHGGRQHGPITAQPHRHLARMRTPQFNSPVAEREHQARELVGTARPSCPLACAAFP